MRLIDADAIKLRYTIGMIADDRIVCVPLKDVRKSIDKTPTIDAVPVVRCKDCKYYYCMECVKPENVGTYWDEEAYDVPCYITVELDHYCSYGERKENV